MTSFPNRSCFADAFVIIQLIHTNSITKARRAFAKINLNLLVAKFAFKARQTVANCFTFNLVAVGTILTVLLVAKIFDWLAKLAIISFRAFAYHRCIIQWSTISTVETRKYRALVLLEFAILAVVSVKAFTSVERAVWGAFAMNSTKRVFAWLFILFVTIVNRLWPSFRCFVVRTHSAWDLIIFWLIFANTATFAEWHQSFHRTSWIIFLWGFNSRDMPWWTKWSAITLQATSGLSCWVKLSTFDACYLTC